MKRYEGYNPVRQARRQTLPPGGYVAVIKKVEETDLGNGPLLLISFDVAEGEHRGFFAEDYRNNQFENKKWRGVHYLNQPRGDGTERDGWAVNAMNNFIAVLQESNPGFAWDWPSVERGDYGQLRGKLLGVLFGMVQWEWEGKTGWNSKCRSLIPAQDVRAGGFETPADKPLSTAASAGHTRAPGGGQTRVEARGDWIDDLPARQRDAASAGHTRVEARGDWEDDLPARGLGAQAGQPGPGSPPASSWAAERLRPPLGEPDVAFDADSDLPF